MIDIEVPYVNIALQHLTIKKQILAAAEKVIDHGQFILGPEVNEFEDKFAEYCGTRFAISVDNGTSALYLALRSLGIGPGDEVITAPNSFLASASSIALIGAKPVFADVGNDYNIDPELFEKAITPKTKAVIPVHLTGHPANMRKIIEIAQQYNIFVIEDCAQAVGAMYFNQKVGSFGNAGCFSLHPLKTLNAVGDGGVITTDNEEFAKKLRKARNHGLRNRDECEFWSYNCRLDTIQAAMLLVKMEYINAWNEARRNNAAFYQTHLSNVVHVPVDNPYEYSVYHTFVIRTERRNDLQDHLRRCGVDSKVHYPIPIHLQDGARHLGYKPGSFPEAERQAKEILSIPVYPELTLVQKQKVVDSILSFYN